jgi:hypothetical protein
LPKGGEQGDDLLDAKHREKLYGKINNYVNDLEKIENGGNQNAEYNEINNGSPKPTVGDEKEYFSQMREGNEKQIADNNKLNTKIMGLLSKRIYTKHNVYIYDSRYP